MKHLFTLVAAVGVFALLLAACGAPAASSAPSVSSAESVSSVSLPTSGVPSSTAAAEGQTAAALLAAIEPAAGLGATLALTQVDLTATGDVPAEDVVDFAGAESTMYSQNGGRLYVVQAQPGKAEAVKEGLEKMKEALLSQGENYKADFPEAYANIEGTLVVVNGDFVVYATSASGDYTALNDAVTAAFAA